MFSQILLTCLLTSLLTSRPRVPHVGFQIFVRILNEARYFLCLPHSFVIIEGVRSNGVFVLRTVGWGPAMFATCWSLLLRCRLDAASIYLAALLFVRFERRRSSKRHTRNKRELLREEASRKLTGGWVPGLGRLVACWLTSCLSRSVQRWQVH